MLSTSKKKLSFIIPIFNEQLNISALYEALARCVDSYVQKYEAEFIFVDDGSQDESWQLLSGLVLQDSRVRSIRFTRNFGHQIAITAGYDYATGDAVITLDGDMQHPPYVIKDMIAAWEKGFLVVYGRRRKTEESFLKKISSRLYVSLLNQVSGNVFPQGVADFRLLDKSVVKTLSLCKERFRYVRGAVSLLGYPVAFVDYDQPARARGFSKYNLRKMFSLGFNGLICFSTFPLRIACYIGFLVLITGFFGSLYILIKSFSLGRVFFIYGACFCVLYLLLGMVFILVWILGEYIFRIYELQKGNPSYVVLEQLPQWKNNDTCLPKGEGNCP